MRGGRSTPSGLAVLGAVVAAVAVSCAGPARTVSSFNHKAVATAEQARSSIETVEVVVDSQRRHGLPAGYVSVAVAEAEDDASSALSGFESVQPPSTRSDQVRKRTTDVVGDAVDLLAEVRIRARRGQSLVGFLPELRDAAARLDELTTSVEG